MTFRDRTDAGRQLADAPATIPRPPCVVAAIPRGGVSGVAGAVRGARKIVVAVPCASEPAARAFERAADRVFSLTGDPGFMAVRQYCVDFSSVSDDEAIAMLASARAIDNQRGVAGGRRGR